MKPKYKFEKIFVKDNEVFVLYKCETKIIKNSETLNFLNLKAARLKLLKFISETLYKNFQNKLSLP